MAHLSAFAAVSVFGTALVNIADITPAGAQTLRCYGEAVTIAGTMGDDVLLGTPGRDVIHGLAGDDTLVGFAGNDVLCGGGGDDALTAGNGDDILIGGDGNDRLVANAGDDRLLGITGDDTLHGGPGSDFCNGGAGRNTGTGCRTRRQLVRPTLLLQRNSVQLAPERSATYALTLSRNEWFYLNFDNPSFIGTIEDRNLDGSWELLDAQGTKVASGGALSDPGAPTRILRTGSHRLVMTAREGGATFTFKAFRAPATVSRMAKNQPVTGRIGIPGEQHRHRFSATAGERLYLDFDNTGFDTEARWWIVPVGKPFGDAVAQSFLIGDRSAQIVIPDTGAYDVAIRGHNDELYDYGFTLRTTTRTVRTVSLDTTMSAGFDRPGEIDVYRFAASAGDVLNLSFAYARDDASRGGTYRLERIGGSDDLLIDRRSICCPKSEVLEESGTYLLTVNAKTDQTFPYTVTLNKG